MMAAHQGHLDVVRELVGAGAGVDVAANGGCTPLFVAAHNGHLDMVRELVRAGADKSVQTQWGTPLEISQNNGHAAVADFLSGRSATPMTRSTKVGGRRKGKKKRGPR